MDVPGLFDIDSGSHSPERCVVAVGIFDGVHRGHARLLGEARAMADSMGAKLFVLTFDPHPDRVLRPCTSSTRLIYPLDIRTRLLLDAGVDGVFVKNFTKRFASESPEEFLALLKRKFPGLAGLVTGENFRFGRNASAGVEWLREHAALLGVETRAVAGVMDGGGFVSSTRLRRALLEGDMDCFERLCGRPYFAEGVVSPGRRLGRELGFPTLNLQWTRECMPPFGVYAAELLNLEDGVLHRGVASFGTNPTVGKVSPVVETNLFDRVVDFGEGTRIRVYFRDFLRPEEKFDSLDALKAQIALDRSRAEAHFKKKPD